MNIYRLETKKYKWLLYYGLGQITLGIIAQIMSKYTGQTSLLNIISASLDVMWFLSFPAGAIIAGFISKQLNRPVIIWFIFALFLSPIALIILSRKSYYINPEINSIYRKYEVKYFDSVGNTKQQLIKGKITQQEFKDLQKTTMIELESKMNDEIQLKQAEIYARLNESINESSKTIYPESNDTKLAYEKCPACETKLNGNEIDCPECGLRLK